ncbi:MAG: hypothetical protein QGI63_00185 [Rhodospirillales bacterium]|nr:hypothetical protein [Rhodospirillales bacterium]MDP6772661.1 hypothetical protein [Rhodospirillales bacterium]
MIGVNAPSADKCNPADLEPIRVLAVVFHLNWQMDGAMKRLGFVLPCLLVLQACALPLPVRVAGWMADGFSLLISQKSIADHGLSLVAQRDCSILRGFTGEGFCFDDVSDTVYADASEFDVDVLTDFETAAGAPPIETPSAVIDHSVAVLAAVVPRRPPRTVETALDPAAYVVSGCFRTRDLALSFAEHQVALHPVVVEVEAEVGDDTRYLVTTDPLGGREGEDTPSRSAMADAAHTWVIGSTPACGMIARRDAMFGGHAV